MDGNNAVMYKFRVEPTESLKKELCCDAAHGGENFATRYGCTWAKILLLYEDGSYAFVHAEPHITPGYVVRPPTSNSLAFLAKKQKRDQAKQPEHESKSAGVIMAETSSTSDAAIAAFYTEIKKLEQAYPVSISLSTPQAYEAAIARAAAKSADGKKTEPAKASLQGEDEEWEMMEAPGVDNDYVVVPPSHLL